MDITTLLTIDVRLKEAAGEWAEIKKGEQTGKGSVHLIDGCGVPLKGWGELWRNAWPPSVPEEPGRSGIAHTVALARRQQNARLLSRIWLQLR